MSILTGLRVVELSENGELSGRLLADLGADVVKIVPPELAEIASDPATFAEYLKADLAYAWFNGGKRCVALDAETESGRASLLRAIARADVLIHDGRLAALAEEQRATENPGLIDCEVSGLGRRGPYEHYLAPDLVAFAMSGQMSVAGEPDREPIAPPYSQAMQMASITATFGVTVALRARRADGLGQHVDASGQSVLASGQHLVTNYMSNASILSRGGSRSAVGGSAAPQGVFDAADGHVYLFTLWEQHWRSLKAWLGNAPEFEDPIFENRHFRTENSDWLDSYVEEWTRSKPKQQLFVDGQARGVFIGSLNSPGEFVRDEHVVATGYMSSVEDPTLGAVSVPGHAYSLSETPLIGWRSPVVVGREFPAEWSRASPVSSPATTRAGAAPLTGVRILDFTHAVAGPTMTRVLAEFGAEVIKVESKSHNQRGRVNPDQLRRARQQAATFVDLNRNKRSISLDMNRPEARDIARRLVAASDVVVNNFSPRVMEKWELDYRHLTQLRGDVIGVDMPGFGSSGPYRDFIAGAVIVASLTGTYSLWDYPENARPAGPPAWYPDYGAGLMAAMATVAAIIHRDETGVGQHIEQSQLNAVGSFIAPAYLEYTVAGRDSSIADLGARTDAPWGAFRCSGADAWCVVAVESTAHWNALVSVIGSPDGLLPDQTATATARRQERERIDAHLQAWTREHTPHQVMTILQSAGVPAGVVQNAEDLCRDPHLWSRGFFADVQDDVVGSMYYPGAVVNLDRTSAVIASAPAFGEANDYVLGHVLGMDSETVASLQETGVLG